MPELPILAELTWLRLDLLGRLLLAAALGGLVGLEREWSGKPAGFRTNLLICVGAALLTELSITVAAGAAAGVPADPGRIAAQIVSGVGFLGAGTIIQSRAGVVGLTTAATLWVVAAIGMAVGARAYTEAVGTTALVVAALLLLGRLEGRLARTVEGVLRLRLRAEPRVTDRIEELLADRLEYTLTEMERVEDAIVVSYEVSGHRRHWQRLVSRLLEVDGVESVRRD